MSPLPLAVEAMPLRNRNELKSLFKNNSRLSETQFAELIDSMLNKRDDQFHGVWKPGRTYRPGDVVIHGGALWIMTAAGEICSRPDAPPSKENPQWSSLIIPVDDEDWEVLKDEGVMWAKVFDRIGIGIGSLEGERPEARLDIRKLEQGRWLVFPEQSEQTQVSMLHYGSSVESSYLTTGVSLEEVNWLSDASKGFVFRKGRVLTEEAEALELNPADGQVLLVIKPKRIQGGGELATLGLNVEDPVAMLDISDGDRGQLLFTPDEKRDPALTIINLDPKTDQNYLAMGVGVTESAFVSDVPNGFVFRQGSDYGTYCAEKSINQGDLLMIVRQATDPARPQVGIGTGNPRARLDVVDGDRTQIQLLPEHPPADAETPSPGTSVPLISLLNLQPPNQQTYLTTGLSDPVAGWVTNAPQGFVFRQGGAAIDGNPQRLDQGKTHLVIREDGRIGMGTENPYTRLEIVNESGSGKFLFNLDQKVNPALGILNLRPGSKENYFTLGADNDHALLVTDSQYGFLFRAGREYNQNDSQIDVNQGDTLVSIRPEGRGRMGIGKLPINYELDVHGMARVFTLYQDTHEGLMTRQKPLTGALKKVRDLRPISFEWTAATGFAGEGEQLGLLAHEVDDVFPQVVKTASDGTKAIAYQNLVPALIQALQELVAERNDTQSQLDTLRNEFTAYQQQMGDRLQSLTDRLEQLERHFR